MINLFTKIQKSKCSNDLDDCLDLLLSKSGLIFFNQIFINDQRVLDLYGLDLEVETDEGEHDTLEILDQVVETSKTVWVSALININQTTNLASCERDMLISDNNLQLLPPDSVRLRPQSIIFSLQP